MTPNGVAGATIAPRRYLVWSSAADSTLIHATAGTIPVGVSGRGTNASDEDDVIAAAGESVECQSGYIHEIEAGGSFDAGASVGPGANGVVVEVTDGHAAGTAKQAATGAGDVVEINWAPHFIDGGE